MVLKCSQKIQENFTRNFESFQQISFLQSDKSFVDITNDISNSNNVGHIPCKIIGFTNLEDGVCDTCQGSLFCYGINTEHVNTPLLRVLQYLGELWFILHLCLNTKPGQSCWTRDAIGVTQWLLDTRYSGQGCWLSTSWLFDIAPTTQLLF